MLTGLPLFHFFDCGNSYCGEHEGMRYLLEVTKREDDTKQFTETIWPEPWCLEKTDEELREIRTYPYTPEGLEDAVAYLTQAYKARPEYWEKCLRQPWDEAAAKAIEKAAAAEENQ